MIRNILIEGMDCSGKSTLVKKLKNSLQWDAKALGHQAGDQYSRYLAEYATLQQTVLDRGHISELVFSSIFQRRQPFTEPQQQLLNQLISQDFLVIFANPSLAAAKQRYVERSDASQQIKLGQLQQAHSLFDQWFYDHPLPNLLVYRSINFEELDQLSRTVKQLVEVGS